jgi:Ca2+-binding EF-hand superfamily protein
MTKLFQILVISDKEKLAILKEMEKDGNKAINFEKFKKIVGPKYFRKFASKELEDTFRLFDKGWFIYLF